MSPHLRPVDWPIDLEIPRCDSDIDAADLLNLFDTFRRYNLPYKDTKQSSVPGHSPAGVGTASDAGPSNDAHSRSRSTMFDPARDV